LLLLRGGDGGNGSHWFTLSMIIHAVRAFEAVFPLEKGHGISVQACRAHDARYTRLRSVRCAHVWPSITPTFAFWVVAFGERLLSINRIRASPTDN
jgi:hypothetical protein